MEKNNLNSITTKCMVASLILSGTYINFNYINEKNEAEANSAILDAQRGCSVESEEDNTTSSSEDQKTESDTKGESDSSILNSKQKKKVKKIYDYMSDRGFSGAFIAGIIGNWITESQIDETAEETGGTGIGLGQWSFERNEMLKSFAKSEGKEWKDLELQLKFMFEKDSANKTLKEIAKDASDDPADNAVLFHAKWEISADSEAKIRNERGGNAKAVWDYMKKEGMDAKKDDEKIDKAISGEVESSGASASSDENEKETTVDACGGESKDNNPSGDGSKIGDSTKVNGKKGTLTTKNYEWDELPEKYKKHVVLPKFDESYLDKPGNVFPALGYKGQCTELTYAYMSQLWQGEQPTNGNGNAIYKAYKAKGAKITDKPTVGYGFSSDPPYAQATDPSVGHTGVVVGVMDDGKFIMANYNVPPKPAPSRTLYYTVVDGTDGNITFFSGVGKPKGKKE